MQVIASRKDAASAPGVSLGLWSPADEARNVLGSFDQRQVLTSAALPVSDLDIAVDQPAPHRDDCRRTNEFGVLELHPWTHLAGSIVVQDVKAQRGEVTTQRFGCLEDRLILACSDDVYVDRSDVPRPGVRRICDRVGRCVPSRCRARIQGLPQRSSDRHLRHAPR